MAKRVLAAMERASSSGTPVVAAMHRKPIMVVLAHVLGIPHDRIWRLATSPASLTTIEVWFMPWGKKAVDAAYARCLEILMAGPGYPMVGSHDPEMIRGAQLLAARSRRRRHLGGADALRHPSPGAAPARRQRTTVRAYVPYGADWYGYFMRRLAERPANLRFFLRSLATKSCERTCPWTPSPAFPRRATSRCGTTRRVRPSAPRSSCG